MTDDETDEPEFVPSHYTILGVKVQTAPENLLTQTLCTGCVFAIDMGRVNTYGRVSADCARGYEDNDEVMAHEDCGNLNHIYVAMPGEEDAATAMQVAYRLARS